MENEIRISGPLQTVMMTLDNAKRWKVRLRNYALTQSSYVCSPAMLTRGDRLYWPIYNIDISNPNAREEEIYHPDELLEKVKRLRLTSKRQRNS